ncbi:sensor histidine kinase [Neorhizobium sp. NPDC001467]|uniref:sensor histidine kinase n=1 Tax=Neorhizobium sp. NPDC001467 TaxID=3390595 RepID=UPI003D059C71
MLIGVMSSLLGHQTEDLLQKRFRRAWALFAIVALGLGILLGGVVERFARVSALAGLEARGRTEADLKVALLRASLERPRALPLLLAGDRDVREVLSAVSGDKSGDPGASSDRQRALNAKLEDLVVQTNASVIYVIGRDGIAIASSNWREPTSFVGNDYAFRAYFSGAMRDGSAEHFALGSVSNRPGLYISQRVGPPEAPVGVVVAKMEFDALEAEWRNSGRPSYVIDSNHVVLVSSVPSWRFMTTQALQPAALGAIRESLQFGDAPLLPLPFSSERRVSDGAALVWAVMPGEAGPEDFLRIDAPIASTPWMFEYLMPVRLALADAMREARLTALLGWVCVAALAGLLLRRRQVTVMTMAREQRAREDLEERVAARTIDLSLARDRLEAEIADHEMTDRKLQAVQQDLVQANRLAILGQVAAGVAHEINQPLATIRAYADNSKVFLERGKTESAVENLSLIASLTERIGIITEDLKALARKGRAEAVPVLLKDVLAGALMLVRSRFAGKLDMLTIFPPPPGLQVMGSRLRLEQVFINLMLNALEAVEGQPDAHITVTTEVAGERVAVRVSDNGPGVPAKILAAMFEPFNSTKERGLGLGLVISKDIVSDYGGRIAVESEPGHSCFTVFLASVEAQESKEDP